MEIPTIGKGHLPLTEPQESLHGLIVVVDVGIGGERVDPIHLHRDFSIDRNLATNHRITKLSVIHWNSIIGQHRVSPFANDPRAIPKSATPNPAAMNWPNTS